jgi:hypothetical protein
MSDVLVDKVAAFTFSRKPRAERMASTLSAIVKELNMTVSDSDLLAVATAAEPYARKDFAVRYGKLETDIAPTKNIG